MNEIKITPVMWDQHWHAKDSDCTPDADGICTGCGVDHSETCPECGNRGFHTATCGLVDNGYTHSVDRAEVAA